MSAGWCDAGHHHSALNPVPRYRLTVEVALNHHWEALMNGCVCCAPEHGGSALVCTPADGPETRQVRPADGRSAMMTGCACCAPGREDEGPALVCTLAGGPEARQVRLADWRAAISQATGRRPAAGGVTLTFDHDSRLAAELGRLAAVEYECCSFFTFTLGIGPAGMTFTAQAPDAARDIVTDLFGEAA